MKRILIVEDDVYTRYLCETLLRKEGYEISAAASAQMALQQLSEYRFDLLLLDLNLPDGDGIEMAQTIRKQYPEIKILMMTVRQEADDRLSGFESGANDYMTKPFRPGELLHRVNNLIGNSAGTESASVKRYCLLNQHQFDVEGHCLLDRKDEKLKLTNGEFRLLSCLLASQGKPVSRSTLLDEVTQGERDGHPRTVDVLIYRLRKVIETDPHHPSVLITVKGFGYQLDPSEKH